MIAAILLALAASGTSAADVPTERVDRSAVGGAAGGDSVVVATLDPPASIAGPWRCTDGDDVAFAAPAFDDAAWKRVVLPDGDGDLVCGGRVTWLRRRVELAPALLERPVLLGVAVGRVDGAYEVYVDGVRVGAHGSVDPLVDPVHTGEAFAIPRGAAADGVVVVAVRIGNNPVLYAMDPGRRLVPSGPLVVGQMPGVDEHAAVVVRDAVRDRVGGFLSMGLLFIFVILYHILVWVLRRDRLGYLWFGLSSLLVFLWLALTTLRSTETLPMSSTTAAVIGNFFGSLTNAAFLEFFWRFVQQKRPTKPWRIYQYVLVAIAFIGFIPGWGLGLTASPLVIIAKVGVPICGLVLLVRWGLGGARDAWVILVGMVVGVAGALLEVVVEHGGGKMPIAVSPGIMAFAFFMLVMAVALIAQFARSLDDVDRSNKVLRETNASIARFVPFGFLDALERKSVNEVVRGDSKQREMAVMFCDVRGFTTLAESLGPDRTFRFINDYLSRMEPEIYKGAGFINQYLGDGIMALFPSTTLSGVVRSGADGAVAAAMGMVRALLKLNAERATRGEPEIKIGAGLHIGPLMIGTIGGGEQLDNGVIGDCVNAAARIEGMTKMYAARVLLSGEVVTGLSAVRPVLRHLDVVRAKGKSEATSIFEILDCDDDADLKKQTLTEFGDARRLYAAGDFAAAAVVFDRVLAVCPRDGAARLLRERCDELIAAPPEGTWAGVYTMTSK